ncbi:MAG: 2-phospho-L-lactate guanylyltransferase [Acidimicrobiales bacterium]|nr:2-phospho-L-lactate guanylyltransferase [Acidimicrobiales bacterium]
MPIEAAVLVPVKAFARAKVRLAGALDGERRAALAREMASRVVAAADPLPVYVVCDDESVRDWATSVGATVIWKPGRGLNGAVTEGVAALGLAGYDRVVVAHGDLPYAKGLSGIASFDGITLVPDRWEDGTNVIALPARAGFRFCYGPGSFKRHREQAATLGFPLRIIREPRLGWDVDRPEDLVPPIWAPKGLR